MLKTVRICARLGLLALVMACGDPPLQPASVTPGTDVDNAQLDATFAGVDVEQQPVGDAVLRAGDGGGTAAGLDASKAHSDVASGNDDTADSQSPAPDGAIWQAPDIDTSSLKVIATEPPLGALGAPLLLQFTLTFSAPVIDAGIQPYTILVSDPTGAPIEGDFTVKGAKVTFKATKPAPYASRIDAVVTTIVQGTQGQSMQAPFKYHLHTVPYDNSAPWLKLAERYAPVIHLGVTAKDPSWPNKEGLSFDPKAAQPTVGYTVAATHSHYFVSYVFRRPIHAKTSGSPGFSPDLSGATVVVARWPKEHPAGLFTWFKNKNDEQWWGWLAKQGGLVPPGYSATKANVRSVVAQTVLFPPSTDAVGVVAGKTPSPARYTAFLPATSHQSCWWSDTGDVTAKQCETHKAAKLAMNLIKLVPFAASSAPPYVPQPPTGVPPTITYTLASFDALLWPRRNDPALFAIPISFSYKPAAGRPAGMTAPMGSKYASPTTDFGRPPWAWRWRPSTNTTYYDMPRGTLFMDPAWAVYQRVGGVAAKLPKYDPKTHTGYALDYCYAPALFIDKRNSPACVDILPAG
jgi:hypothetical protein